MNTEVKTDGIAYGSYNMHPVGVFKVTHLIGNGMLDGGSVGYGHLVPHKDQASDDTVYPLPVPGIIQERDRGVEVIITLPQRQGREDVPEDITYGSIIRIGDDLVFKVVGADVPIHDQQEQHGGIISHVGYLYRDSPHVNNEGLAAVLYQSTAGADMTLSVFPCKGNTVKVIC